MRPYSLLSVLFLILFFSEIASAGDEQTINSQLQQGGVIHLQAQTYVITDSIILQSDTILEGEPGTIIKLTDNAGWPTWQPLIKAQGLRNVTIRNIKIDANSDNQQNAPTWQGHTGHEGAKNWGMGNYNIIHAIDCDSFSVHDCTFSNSLGDGFRVKTSSNIKFFNDTVYRMGHEGAYFIDSSGIQAYNNRMTSRTSNDLRIWNCQHVRFYKNVLDSELDLKSLSGMGGCQIEDSKGTMQDIEVCDNIIYDTWGAGMWLIAYDTGSGNTQGILIHHNLFLRPGQSYNIPYTSAITNDGCKGTQIFNNCFDGARNDGIRNQADGQGTQIKDNIFDNSLPHAAISQRGTGFGIADLAASGLSISNNCFFNNANGNCYGCSSSGDDLADPKAHNTSSGWWWTGTTWTCAEVPPMPLGSIQATQTRNTTDTDTHEFNSIFDILNTQLSDSAYVNQSSVFNPDKTLMSKGTESAYIDVIGSMGA